MLQWDGFSVAQTSLKSCWAVYLTVLNAGKENPVGSIPVLFIPSSSEKLIKHSNVVLASFLKPLLADMEEIFLNEIDVVYAYPTEDISEHIPSLGIDVAIKLRGMRLTWNKVNHENFGIWTGDHPAQCKVGCLKLGGYGGCRRHKLSCRWRGIPDTNKGLVEYFDSRRQGRYPSSSRTTVATLESIQVWRELPEGKEKNLIAREAGISSASCLWRLYDLYGFDVLHDLVYDIMHILSLCVFKKYVHLLVKYAEERGLSKEVDEAMATMRKIRPLDVGARWPRSIYSLGYYKAEEYQIFVMWCLPHILDHLNLDMNSTLGALGMVLNEIGRLFYSHSRKYGWTVKAMTHASAFLSAWRIRMEESAGPNSSPLEHVAGTFFFVF